LLVFECVSKWEKDWALLSSLSLLISGLIDRTFIEDVNGFKYVSKHNQQCTVYTSKYILVYTYCNISST
jgi:hypothetical protein